MTGGEKFPPFCLWRNDMNENNLNKIVIHCNAIEELLGQFDNVTNALLQCETENAEEIDALIARRQELVELMEIHHLAYVEAIDLEDRQTAATIRGFLAGNTSGHINEALLQVHNAIVNLRSAHSASMEKENQLHLQFASRRNEIKDKLEKLQQDKKKIDFYSSTVNAPKKVGHAFDSRS